MYNLTSVYYARIERAVQVMLHEYYLQGVATKDEDNVVGIPVPNFPVMLVKLTRGTFHNSAHWIDIPMEYTEAVTTRPPMVTMPAATSTTSSTASTASTSQPSGRSTLSTLTTATPALAPAERVANPAPDAEFAAITLRPGCSRDIFRGHPPPRNTAGEEMCVAWWTRSGCFANCGKRNTHRPFANTASEAEKGVITICMNFVFIYDILIK